MNSAIRGSKCGCTPGSYDTGWHEVRSDKCTEAEIAEFHKAIQVAEDYIKERRT